MSGMEILDDTGYILNSLGVNAVGFYFSIVYLTREKGLVQEELGLLQYHI